MTAADKLLHPIMNDIFDVVQGFLTIRLWVNWPLEIHNISNAVVSGFQSLYLLVAFLGVFPLFHVVKSSECLPSKHVIITPVTSLLLKYSFEK